MTTVELIDHEFVRVGGPDARRFLQGQLSCNVDDLTPSRSLTGALCNLKGRVIADLRLLQLNGDCLLQTGAGMADKIIATLSRYAVFSKVELRRENLAAVPLGLIDENSRDWARLTGGAPEQFDAVAQTEDLAAIRISGCSLRFEIWCFTDTGAERLRGCLGGARKLPPRAWQREDLHAGIVHVSPPMSEQYTPQLLNYDISGVISFDKGCYTGQEVVARMYYRGKPKQRLYLLNSPAPIDAGNEVRQELGGTSRNGEILAFSHGNGEPNFLLAILDTAMVSGGATLSIDDQPGSILQLVPLPYMDGKE